VSFVAFGGGQRAAKSEPLYRFLGVVKGSQAMAKFDKKLKAILVKRGLMTGEQADLAQSNADEEGKELSTIVLEKGYVEEKELVAAVAREMNIPPIDVARVVVDDDVLEVLPQDLATYYCVLPISKMDDVLTIAVANPFDIVKLDDVKIVTGCQLRPVVSTEHSILEAIPRNYNKEARAVEEIMESVGKAGEGAEIEEVKESDGYDLSDASSAIEGLDSPVVKLVNMMVYQAIKERASDVHIEPYEKRIRIRYRTDGSLREVLSPPKRMLNAIVSRIKIMSELDIAERRIPQDGKFQLKVDGRQVDFRVSILPTMHGEKTVLRILDTTNLAYKLELLGFEERALLDLRKAAAAPYGMILVTGPTGSGKSTTLYSVIKEIMSDEENIVTVEDPVEYQIEGINQVQVSTKKGLTFAAALRSILRQDPDTILVGEIRDLETVDIAVKAALTGHLVLSTLHTNDSPQAILRMIDMGVDPFMISAAILIFSAQRLARKICPDCKVPLDHLPPVSKMQEIGFTSEEIANKPTIYKAVGCSKCNGSGYRGRFALLETLPVTDDIRRMIIDGASVLDIKRKAIENGMITVRRAGLLNVMRGITSLEEVLNVSLADFQEYKKADGQE
jgi:type IV pilus assembly protein PilB